MGECVWLWLEAKELHLTWYYDIMETKMWRDKVLCRV